MCRIAAYLGPERSLHELWLAPPHNLVVQSYAPKEMNGALLNADGFGMAWYTRAAEEPALYRTMLPLWNDENVVRMARHLVTGCAIANVRSATPGMGVQTANVSPFVRGRWALTHNGLVRDFRRTLLPRLRRTLSDEALASIEGTTDSEYLIALIASYLSGDPVDGVRRALREIAAMVREAETSALLAFVLSDGERLIAVRHAVDAQAPTLYTRRREDGGFEIASERLDERGWQAIEPGTMVVVDRAAEARSEAL
jgi:glutamine amidotransferase